MALPWGCTGLQRTALRMARHQHTMSVVARVGWLLLGGGGGHPWPGCQGNSRHECGEDGQGGYISLSESPTVSKRVVLQKKRHCCIARHTQCFAYIRMMVFWLSPLVARRIQRAKMLTTRLGGGGGQWSKPSR